MTTEREAGSNELRRWIPAALVVLSLLAFHDVGRFDFVGLDDPAYVSENTHVSRGLDGESLAWSLTTGYWGNWHPLVWWSHMLVAELFGVRPGPHHLANLALHAACAAMLYLALRRLTGRAWPAALVAALFAVHPLHVESVAWVSARKDTLSTFFWWLTVWLWARRVERPSAVRWAAVLAAYAAGLASKSMLVTLPFALLLFDVWPLRRRERPLALVVEKLPLVALAAAASAVALHAQRGAGALQGLGGTPLAQRLGNAVVAYVVYLRKTLWPADLAVYYPQVERGTAEVAAAAAVLIAISALAWTLRRRVPAVAVGWAFYLGTLVPVIGLVQIGAQALADRYTYLPLTGVFVAVVWGLRALPWRPAWAGAVAAGVVLAACVVGTRAQLPSWRDSRALYADTLAVTERNYFVHGMYGTWLLKRGETAGAIEQLERAVEIDPRFVLGRENLGVALTGSGRHAEAVEHFERALTVDPRRISLHRGRAVALLRAGRVEAAIEGLERALELSPDDARLRADLARARALRRRR